MRMAPASRVPTCPGAGMAIAALMASIVPWPYPAGGVLEFYRSQIAPQQGIDRWFWMIGAVDLWRHGRPRSAREARLLERRWQSALQAGEGEDRRAADRRRADEVRRFGVDRARALGADPRGVARSSPV